jgi:hypothetical protein
MKREEWLALAERCEKATGPDYRIDAAISIALGDVPKGFTAGKIRGFESRFSNKSGYTWDAPRYTSSLDALSRLFILGMPKENGFVGGYEARLWLKNDLSLGSRGSGSTLALALCAAFCRAMAERD